MTDNEIIKALEYCKDCSANLNVEIIDLINRQQAEIERLQKVNDSFTDIGKLYSEIKYEAYKEFAERLDKNSVEIESKLPNNQVVMKTVQIFKNMIKSLVKEMVGEELCNNCYNGLYCIAEKIGSDNNAE